MQQWHFHIYGKVIIDGNTQNLNIHPENIRDILRISDYQNENMSKMMMHVSLDKNLVDLILTNAKTARIYLKIEKFDKQDDGETRNYITHIEDEFSIFVSDDINYSKEVDYNPVAEEMDGKREDVYKQLDIGLISKSSIEANKNLANTVFYKTDIFNMIGYYMRSLHLLIEPFKYNPTMDQLIIPPQETLVKTVEFLNNIKVFYDTQYLFFIEEPYCTYLISRSGQGIEKKDDIYKDVCFNILPKNNENSARQGMAEDAQEKRYYIDINVADSKYTIDHDTSKIYTKIQEIINPDIDNTISALDSVQSAINSIGKTVNQIKNLGGSLKSTFESMPHDLYKYKMTFNSSVLDFLNPTVSKVNTHANDFKNLLSQLPASLTIVTQSSSSGSGSGSSGSTSKVMPVLPTNEKASDSDKITQDTNNMNQTYGEVQSLNPVFGNATDNASKLAYDSGKIDNAISCFTPVNVQDGVNDTSKNINILNSSSSSLGSHVSTDITPKQHFVSDTKNNYNLTIGDIQSIVNKIESRVNAIKNQAGNGSIVSGLEQVEAILEQMKSINNTLHDSSSSGIMNIMNSNLDGITSVINDFSQIPTAIENTTKNLTSCIPNLANVVSMDFKSKIKSLATDIRTIGKSAESALDKIRNIGKKGENLSFGFGDLFNAKNNLSAIGDLSGIGKLGISSFDTRLMIGGCFGGAKDGIKIMKTNNDNANKVKNIKSEMENMVNQISINKYDLDPSVFTPNKRYTIKNYDGHSDKDGLFLLNKKVELYIREDDTFTCNTILTFCKIADTQSGDKGSTAAYSTQSSTNNTSQTKANEIATTNSELEKSTKYSNTSDTYYNTGQKVQNNTNTGTQYLLDMAQKGGFGARSGLGDRVLGRTSITDVLSRTNSFR